MNDRDVLRPNFGGWVDQQGRRVETGGGPPHDGGMEARIAKLEVATDYIKRDISSIGASVGEVESKLTDVRERLAAIEVKLDNVPTKLGMWAAVGTVVLTVGGAVWWMVQEFLGPLLAKAVGS